MSWATRRRAAYGGGVLLFFGTIIGVPLMYWYLTIPPTCVDGIQNQNETSIDRGGPCPLLDERMLAPAPILWSRSFRVRDGSFNSVAYIQNSNDTAGVRKVAYRFSLYDSENVLVADRTGETFVMPGAVTPVFESGIQTGNRMAVRTYFQYTETPQWEKLEDRGRRIVVNDKELTNAQTEPRLSATVRNTTVRDLTDVIVVATVFDQTGNAFATSQTRIEKLRGGEKQSITFTWPDPFEVAVGRVDVIPVLSPVAPEK